MMSTTHEYVNKHDLLFQELKELTRANHTSHLRSIIESRKSADSFTKATYSRVANNSNYLSKQTACHQYDACTTKENFVMVVMCKWFGGKLGLAVFLAFVVCMVVRVP